MQEHNRGQWGSNLGFLMAAVGSAVGLGNIWGFPYKMGKTGGFAFLIVYLALVLLVGIVVMLGELALGRSTGKSPIEAYGALKAKYKIVGVMAIISPFVILCFYCVLGGMVMRYMLGFLVSIFGADGFSGQGDGVFGYLLYDYKGMILFFIIFLVVNMGIIMGGVQSGIERFTKIAMPALAVCLVIIIVFVAMQPGAKGGYEFMFKPDFSVFSDPDIGFFGVLKTAAGQMFFSLSLGMGAMITYGSYLSKKESLQRNSLIIPIADTVIALMAGMMVMPACAAYGIDFGKGPGLLFASMQGVFLDGMGGAIGNVMGFLFYFLVFIAAITSSISLLEACSATIIDKQIAKGKAPRRKTAAGIFTLCIFILGLPIALDALGSGGALVKAPYELMGLEAGGAGYAMWNDCWLDFYDLIAEGILMPLGALLMSLIFGWVVGPKYIYDECEQSGHPFKFKPYFDVCFKVIVPIIMVVVLYAQITDFF